MRNESVVYGAYLKASAPTGLRKLFEHLLGYASGFYPFLKENYFFVIIRLRGER